MKFNKIYKFVVQSFFPIVVYILVCIKYEKKCKMRTNLRQINHFSHTVTPISVVLYQIKNKILFYKK